MVIPSSQTTNSVNPLGADMTSLKYLLAVTLLAISQSNGFGQIPQSSVSPGTGASSVLSTSPQASAGAFGGTSIPSAIPTTAIPNGIGHKVSQRLFPILSHLKQRHAINKAKLRASPLGKLLKDMRKPLSQLSGGIVPAEPKPNAVELQQPGAAGSAAKIKKDQLEAPNRIAAIKALSKVDCNWYHEAQLELILALRTDRVECVRYEAALALSQCNCCSKAIVQALKICVAGTDIDGNPKENSPRVRDQAAIALEGCLSVVGDNVQPLNYGRPEVPYQEQIAPGNPVTTASTEQNIRTVAYYQRVQTVESNPVQSSWDNARDVLSAYRSHQTNTNSGSRSGGGSVSEIWKRSK